MLRQLRRLVSPQHGRIPRISDLLHREVSGVLFVVLLWTEATAQSVRRRRRGWFWFRSLGSRYVVRRQCGFRRWDDALERACPSLDFVSVDLCAIAVCGVDDSGGADDFEWECGAANQ